MESSSYMVELKLEVISLLGCVWTTSFFRQRDLIGHFEIAGEAGI